MRLDKFLCKMNLGTRSRTKAFIRQGLVKVNGFLIKSPDFQVDEEKDQVTFQGEILRYQKFHYFMLNKPAGTVSATADRNERTVLELLGQDLSKGLFPVGRLDKDTEGLLLITDDGDLAHHLLSPKRHVGKTYLVTAEHPLTLSDIAALEEGMDIGEKKPTLPASVQRLSEKELLLTIHEGKFHQVKRMLQAVGNQVIALKRVGFGPLKLDEGLKSGEYRKLSEQEVSALYESGKKNAS